MRVEWEVNNHAHGQTKMVITIPASQTHNGPRPIDPNRDLPQIVDLLRLVFGRELTADGQNIFRNLPDKSTPAVFWRLDPVVARLMPGFVWESDGQLVGNVSLLPTRTRKRFLIANVAVHPNFRRQGIAHILMCAAHDEVRKRQGREIYLQVDFGNEPAIALYQGLGYALKGSMTTWRSSVSRVRDVSVATAASENIVGIRKLDRRRWKEAYRLDTSVVMPDLHWPEVLETDIYKSSLWSQLTDFLSGRFQHSWMSVDEENRMIGLATISGEWGRPHQLALRVHPLWKGRLEEPLLQQLINELRKLPRRNLQLIHLADDAYMNQLLTVANFDRSRTLTHMRLDINK